jgi:hypothetical protein
MTSLQTYLDLDLQVAKVGKLYRARLTAPDGGVSTGAFKRPFTADQVKILVLQLGQTRMSMRAAPDRPQTEELDAVREFGSQLFKTVFAGDLRTALDRSLDEAHRKDAGLRIRLNLTDVPELADLPWEYLAVPPHGDFLALSKHTPVVRYLDIADPPRVIAAERPLRMLVMVSNPTGSTVLDTEAEWARLNLGLAAVVSAGQLVLERLDTATLSELRQRLQTGTYHIFHYIGHGGFDAAGRAGLLLLEDEADRPVTTTAEELETALHDHRTLGLAVLNSCEGARAGTSDPFAGTAQHLVRRGLPAVVAMQFTISDRAAISFARGFYSALGAGYPVDAAVAEGRKEIMFAKNSVEWGTPSLIMRARDGRIFDLAPEPRVVLPALSEAAGPPAAPGGIAAAAPGGIAAAAAATVPAPASSPVSPAASSAPAAPVSLVGSVAAVSASPASESPPLASAAPAASAAPVASASSAPARASDAPAELAKTIGIPRSRITWLAFGGLALLLVGLPVAGFLAGQQGAPPPLVLEANPDILEFDDTAVGDESYNGVDINLVEGPSTSVVASLAGPDSDEFSVLECDSGTLTRSGPCYIDVTFSPLEEGPREADLVVTAADTELTIPLIGYGLGEGDVLPSIYADIELVDFSAVEPDTPVTLEIGSDSDEGVEIGAAYIDSESFSFWVDDDDCNGRLLAFDEYCYVSVGYVALEEGAESGTLIIPYGPDEESFLEVPLEGPGIAAG